MCLLFSFSMSGPEGNDYDSSYLCLRIAVVSASVIYALTLGNDLSFFRTKKMTRSYSVVITPPDPHKAIPPASIRSGSFLVQIRRVVVGIDPADAHGHPIAAPLSRRYGSGVSTSDRVRSATRTVFERGVLRRYVWHGRGVRRTMIFGPYATVDRPHACQESGHHVPLRTVKRFLCGPPKPPLGCGR